MGDLLRAQGALRGPEAEKTRREGTRTEKEMMMRMMMKRVVKEEEQRERNEEEVMTRLTGKRQVDEEGRARASPPKKRKREKRVAFQVVWEEAKRVGRETLNHLAHSSSCSSHASVCPLTPCVCVCCCCEGEKGVAFAEKQRSATANNRGRHTTKTQRPCEMQPDGHERVSGWVDACGDERAIDFCFSFFFFCFTGEEEEKEEDEREKEKDSPPVPRLCPSALASHALVLLCIVLRWTELHPRVVTQV